MALDLFLQHLGKVSLQRNLLAADSPTPELIVQAGNHFRQNQFPIERTLIPIRRMNATKEKELTVAVIDDQKTFPALAKALQRMTRASHQMAELMTQLQKSHAGRPSIGSREPP